MFARVTERAHEVHDAVDTSGGPVPALARPIPASWQIVHRYGIALTAAERELPPDRIREHHDRHLDRLTTLIERGRQQRVLRSDLPVEWLVTVAYTLMHAAAREAAADRLEAADAERAVISTILSAYAPQSAPAS